MKCRDCRFLGELETFVEGDYPSVRCTLGLWDKGKLWRWYSWGQTQLNRGTVRRLGDACTKGERKETKVNKNQELMNFVLFGAQLYKDLYQGQLAKDAAVAQIKNLSSALTDTEAAYLLKRVQDLIYH